MRRTNLIRVAATTVAATLIAAVGWPTVANAAAGPDLPVGKAASARPDGAQIAATNLALGRPTQESGHAEVYDSARVVDGNQGTYWRASTTPSPSGYRSTSARR